MDSSKCFAYHRRALIDLAHDGARNDLWIRLIADHKMRKHQVLFDSFKANRIDADV